jgi:hypothetical protein
MFSKAGIFRGQQTEGVPLSRSMGKAYNETRSFRLMRREKARAWQLFVKDESRAQA